MRGMCSALYCIKQLVQSVTRNTMEFNEMSA